MEVSKRRKIEFPDSTEAINRLSQQTAECLSEVSVILENLLITTRSDP